MAFHGDCSSYPLPDLLQWLDGARKTGALSLSWDAGTRKLFLLSGQIVATSTPNVWERLARALQVGTEADGERIMNHLRSGAPVEPFEADGIRQLATEDLLGSIVDLVTSQGGRFHWSEDPDRGGDEWVSVELSVRHALFESLRRIDEGHDVERVLPHDHLVIRALGSVDARLTTGHVLHRIILKVAEREGGVTLGRLWLTVALAKGVVTRAVYDLLRNRLLAVDGVERLEVDPIADMLEKGAILLKEQQFDAASLVFATLLQRDPSDRRVREFARLAEREHIAALYRELPPLTTFDVAEDRSTQALLKADERNLVSQVHSGWDVSAAVLASPVRELDTLKTLARLVRLGVLSARVPPG